MPYEQPPEQASSEMKRRVLELPTVPELRGYHVTDDPQAVLDALRTGIPLDRGYDTAPPCRSTGKRPVLLRSAAALGRAISKQMALC